MVPAPDPEMIARKVPLDDSIYLARSLLTAAHKVIGTKNAVQLTVRVVDADAQPRVVGMLVWEQGVPPVNFVEMADKAEGGARVERITPVRAARWWEFWR